MLDRKTWIVLLLCGGLLALNIYYKGKLERERAAQEPKIEETGTGDPAKPPVTNPDGGKGEAPSIQLLSRCFCICPLASRP